MVLAIAAFAQRPALEARFIGNMAFAITDGAVTLFSDFPYESGYSRYMTYRADEIRSATPATLSLITHRHLDHWKPALFEKTTWHGRRLYFSGDTESADHLVALTDLDVAFVSPWLYRSVLKRNQRIDAHRVVLYHLEAGQTVSACTGTCVMLRQGETVQIR